MRTKNLFLSLLTLAVLSIIVSCSKKDSQAVENETASKNISLSLLKSGEVNPVANQKDFTILSAAFSETRLFLGLSYIGGSKTNEFQVVWNGQFTTEGDKRVAELIVYRVTTDDTGILTVGDSISSDLTKLAIATGDLKNPGILFKIINSTNTKNAFTIKALENISSSSATLYKADTLTRQSTAEVKNNSFVWSEVGAGRTRSLLLVSVNQYFAMADKYPACRYQPATF